MSKSYTEHHAFDWHNLRVIISAKRLSKFNSFSVPDHPETLGDSFLTAYSSASPWAGCAILIIAFTRSVSVFPRSGAVPRSVTTTSASLRANVIGAVLICDIVLLKLPSRVVDGSAIIEQPPGAVSASR